VGLTYALLFVYIHDIQAVRFGAEVHEKDVEKVDFSNPKLKKVTVEGEDFFAPAVIICTGAEAIWLNAEDEAKHKGRGVSTCATCDGAFFKDKEVIVIGGGDSAMEEATFLTRYCSKVTIINRRDVYRASKVMTDRAKENPKIEFKPFFVVKKWLTGNDKGEAPKSGGFRIGGGFSIGGGAKSSGSDDLTGCILTDTRDGHEEYFKLDGAFIAIGHKPITKFLNGAVATDEAGYILHSKHTMTNIPGVFAAGDVVDTRYRQAITAAGMGCMAAIDAERWMEDEGIHHH
jgi:thioredoxin reductase (NADPH)